MTTANAIRIKRRKYNDPAGGGKPSSLQWGELAYNEVDNILYYGYGSGTTDQNGAISSQDQYPIGGSGQYVDRYSDQTISGDKTFLNDVNISGNLVIAGDSIEFNEATVVLQTMTAVSGGFESLSASGLDIVAPNTDNNDVGYFAVFDTNPDSTLTTLKSVSRSEILDDIGAATSGLTITAGSGLQGGGTLSEDRAFDIVTGYGVDIDNDAVVVDTSEVVVTTGNQAVNGIKTFANSTVFQSGSESSGVTSIQASASNSAGTYFPVFTGSPISESRDIVSRTASEVKSDIGLSNVTNDAQVKKLASSTNGYVPTWNGTNGDALNDGYSVETTLTGGASSLPRADAVKTYVDALLATNDAMIFKGVIDASTNPLYPSGDRGHTYKISVAGNIGGASGPVVEVNDTIICTVDGSAQGDHATVGNNWVILQTNIVDKDILVTGPASVVSNNIAVFDGTTGKIIKDVGLESDKIVMTTGDQTIGGAKTLSDRVTVTASPLIVSNSIVQGNLYLNNTTANTIEFNGSGVSAAPTDGDDPVGTKILLKEIFGVDVPSVSLGLNNSSWWHSVPNTGWDYEWYAGGSKIATLFGDGTFNTTNISGTNFYLNGTKIDATAAQINLLSTGNDGEILWRNNGSIGLYDFSVPLGAYLSSPNSSINITNTLVPGSAIQIEHADTSTQTSTSFPSGTVVGNLNVDDYGHITSISGTNLDDRYVQIADLDTSLNFVSGIASDYDSNSKVLTVYHDDTSPNYNNASNTIGTSGIASITFDRYGHITEASTLTFLTADTVCDAITGCTIDGGTF